ncbi:MAG: prenyltransferase [Chitinophagaceae bacterium]|nr:prenyltransferase [Chitinophagaceae bacterium]
MLHRSTIQLLRFHFSFFLLPVYLFALSGLENIDKNKAVLVFIILHLLVYPSSNGYNSYMDRDTESIGGLKKPMQPTRQLFVLTVIMDIIAMLLSIWVSWVTTVACFVYILFSRMYSYRGIRLKQFPFLGYLTVILNQGGLIYWMVYNAANSSNQLIFPWINMLAAIFLIGGFYPITQVYQHAADRKDGVTTISMKLGKRGTFLFSGLIYAVAFSLLFISYNSAGRFTDFIYLQIFMAPVIIYFLWWTLKVWKDESVVNFKYTMRMNLLASFCTNIAFITLLILHSF